MYNVHHTGAATLGQLGKGPMAQRAQNLPGTHARFVWHSFMPFTSDNLSKLCVICGVCILNWESTSIIQFNINALRLFTGSVIDVAINHKLSFKRIQSMNTAVLHLVFHFKTHDFHVYSIKNALRLFSDRWFVIKHEPYKHVNTASYTKFLISKTHCFYIV